MSDPACRSIDPPPWLRLLLRVVLPCEAMREAIFGDLHEEYVRDVARMGPEAARRRYRDGTLGILAHATWDSFRWRTWTSSAAIPKAPTGTGGEVAPNAAPGERAHRVVHGSRRVGTYAGLAIGAFAVLAIGIVVNTLVFAAVEGVGGPVSSTGLTPWLRGPLVVLVFGLLSGVLLLGSAALAAFVLCLAPRLRGTPVARDPAVGAPNA